MSISSRNFNKWLQVHDQLTRFNYIVSCDEFIRCSTHKRNKTTWIELIIQIDTLSLYFIQQNFEACFMLLIFAKLVWSVKSIVLNTKFSIKYTFICGNWIVMELYRERWYASKAVNNALVVDAIHFTLCCANWYARYMTWYANWKQLNNK